MIVLTPRALDLASITCRHFWHEDRVRTGEGLHSWLRRRATEALAAGDPHASVGGKIERLGITFRFAYEPQGIVLVGVRPTKEGKILDAHK